MEFRLYYKGILKSNGNVEHKHQIREKINEQMRNLWNQHPLKTINELLMEKVDPVDTKPSLVYKINDLKFVPLVSERIGLIAEINILLMRPQEPGFIVSTGGDIDNRLKTIFDALRMPKNHQELPPDWKPTPDQQPFFCLLEDDALITSVSVTTERLLEPIQNLSEVILIIHVKLKITKLSYTNMDLGG